MCDRVRQLTLTSYNASVFKIIQKYAYTVTFMQAESTAYRDIKRNSTYIKLQASEWRDIYNNEYVSKYGNLYLGIDAVAFDPFVNHTGRIFSMFDYLPRTVMGHDFAQFEAVSNEGWAPFYWIAVEGEASSPIVIHINEGITTTSGRAIRIQVNLFFMIVVIFFNIFKLIIMISALVMNRSDPLVTLGDAASSYLERPEPLTEGRCTLGTQELFSSYKDSRNIEDLGQSGVGDNPHNRTDAWRPRLRRYCSSVGFDKAWSAVVS